MGHKKLLLVCSYPYPANTATANRVRFIAKAYLARGEDKSVEVYATEKETRSVFEPSRVTVNVFRLLKQKNLVMRVFAELFYVCIVLFRVFHKKDFLVVTVPSPLLLLICFFRKKNSFSIDVRDSTWDYLKSRGKLGKVIAKLFVVFAKYPFARAKFVTCTNSSESASILKNFRKKSTIIPNGLEQQKLEILKAKQSTELLPNKRSEVLYVGNVGLAQNLMTLVECAKLLDHMEFEILGNGVEKDLLSHYSKQMNLKNVKFTDPVLWDQLASRYFSSDILYAQITEEYSSAIPTKIFEYLATGKIVVLGLPDGVARNTFKRFSGVIFHVPGDVSDCCRAVNEAVHAAKPDRLGNLAILADSFTREHYQREYLSLFDW